MRRFSNRTVLCSWATLHETWLRQAMRAMRVGQRIILIEEDACADERTWDYRDACFEHETDVLIPAWNLMNDRCGIWRKRRNIRTAT